MLLFLLIKRIVLYGLALRQSFCMVLKKGGLMKSYSFIWLWAMALATALSSCEVIGGIFKAGFWTAIILIVLVIALILWLVRRGSR